MTASGWIVVALSVALSVTIGLLWWRSSRQARAVREEASKHTAAELNGARAKALEAERKKADDEAWETFKDNFGPPR